MIRTITPTTSNDLTTLATVRRELGPEASPENDLLIVSLIVQASAMLAGEIGRPFGIETVEEVEMVRASLPFYLAHRWPIVEVVACAIDGETIPLTDLSINPLEGLITRTINSVTSPWPRGKTVIRYRAGYVLTGAERNVPPDLERACISIVSTLFHASKRNPHLRSETVESIGAFAYVDVDKLPIINPDIRATISRHRVPLVA